MGNQNNFPDELRYDNIASSIEHKSTFISNRGSIFPHSNIETVGGDLPTNCNISDDEIARYVESLPKTFDDWLK